MSLFEALAQIVRPTAQRITYYRMPDSRVLDQQLRTEPLAAESGYFQVSAYTIQLAHEREFLSRYIPTVAAVVTETTGATVREHVRVAGPGALSRLETSDLGRAVVVDRPLTPLLPFRGGQVQVVAALVAYQTQDNLRELVDVVSGITELVGGPAVAATAKAIGAVTQSTAALFSRGQKDTIVALDHSWSGAAAGESDTLALREGYWVLVNRPPTPNPDLWIRDGSLLTGPMSAQVEPLVGVDYMVIRIDTTDTRDDWLEFVRDEVRRRDEALLIQGDQAEADRQNRLAMGKILYSDMFTEADKRRRLGELQSYRTQRVEVLPPQETVRVTGQGLDLPADILAELSSELAAPLPPADLRNLI